MAVTTQYTTEYNQDYQDPKLVSRAITEMGIEFLPFRLPATTVAGDATSVVKLRRLPQGTVYLLPFLSRITWSAFGAARVLDIGHAAYTALDLSTTAASAALFDDDIDVSAAGQAALGSDFTQALAPDNGGFKKFESLDGVDIIATVAGGTIPVGETLYGYLAIARP